MSGGPLLCAVADDDSTTAVLETGTALGEAAAITPIFAHVADPDRRHAVERGAEFLASLGVSGAQAYVTSGSPTSALQALAADIGAEAIVVGGKRRGGGKATVPRWLAVNGDCPVLFARSELDLPSHAGPVVCGLDPRMSRALPVARAASRFAALLSRSLVLVHVGNFGHGEDENPIGYEHVIERNRRKALQAVHGVVDQLPPAVSTKVVLDSGWEPKRLAAQADVQAAPLIVVGNRGRGPLRSALIGSVSMELASSAQQLVAVVPPRARRG